MAASYRVAVPGEDGFTYLEVLCGSELIEIKLPILDTSYILNIRDAEALLKHLPALIDAAKINQKESKEKIS